MAKSKKSESTEMKSDAGPPKPAATAKKKVAAKPAPTSSSGMPSINTSLAAENAAKSLIAGLNRKTTGSAPAGAKNESAAFKQMKSGLNKPSGMGNLLDKTHGPPTLGGGGKSNQPFGGAKQVGHNQTFGADVNRAGVPRRTGGG